VIARRTILAAALLAAPLRAHQQKFAVSTISVNPRTRRLEVVHQVPVHDAEHALRRQGAASADIVGSPASREAFARYVAGRFTLRANDGPVALELVGSEITGGSLWVYQEAPALPAGTKLIVNSQILTDVWAKQENRVNLGAGTAVETLVFHGGDPAKAATLR
jgi:hypothetical protein